jgi:hypothetical protein
LRVDRRLQALDPRAGQARLVLEGAHRALGGGADLRIEIRELGVELLDARMLRQQRARLERELGAQVDALLRQAADQLVIGDVRNLDRLARADHLANQVGLRLRVGLRRARLRQLRVEI